MNILMVSDIYYPHPDGIPVYIYYSAKGFKKSGTTLEGKTREMEVCNECC